MRDAVAVLALLLSGTSAGASSAPQKLITHFNRRLSRPENTYSTLDRETHGYAGYEFYRQKGLLRGWAARIAHTIEGAEEDPWQRSVIARPIDVREFRDLNKEMGKHGVWFLFRAVPSSEGKNGLTLPHMSMLIGNRVYEVAYGSKRKDPYPQSKSIEHYLAEWKSESARLEARPGLFIAQRIVLEDRIVRKFGRYYLNQIRKFNKSSEFDYETDPSRAVGSDNCVTFLMKPFRDPSLAGLSVWDAKSIHIQEFSASPLQQMIFNADAHHNHLETLIVGERTKPFDIEEYGGSRWKSVEHLQLTPFLFDQSNGLDAFFEPEAP